MPPPEDDFGWDLHLDRKCARLFKPRQHNPALTPKQRHLLELTRRDEFRARDRLAVSGFGRTGA